MQKGIFYSVILFILVTLNIYPQTYGRLYSKTEANTIYGPVLKSVEISTSQLQSFFERSPGILMFKVINDNVAVLGANREFIYSSGLASFTENDVFTVFSVSIIQELLKNGNSEITMIEQRERVLTITNGDTTLEFGTFCPPYCG